MPVDKSAIGFNFAMLSSLGRVRSGNEDFCAALPENGVFVVCDGMGGAAAGEVASELAATTFLDHLNAVLPLPEVTESLLDAAVQMANSVVFQRSRRSPNLRGMGTTLVALVLPQQEQEWERELWLAHVGDSRCYRLRGGELIQLTQDHSLVQEQVMAGQLTPEQAERSPMRNIITRAIGSAARVMAEIRRLDPQPGDLYLLASDGLTRELPDETVAMYLSEHRSDLEATCRSLIDAANEAGGHDNITVLLLQINS
ncbi:Stp1/IreP family PP2C-type Ser/Thr phosphatase [Granulicella arctica]|uniref:Protein phosphatase n=1 Tax=Granulicella arctica TaxID=940613 RepID=A0A7Y9PK83_9BACT|nr:Stp1/IreP family PP2C-type Ser/Thr phosphatase [Granulicella arctica]NYF81376.1 protein phosphatase [Granulicella arctica]